METSILNSTKKALGLSNEYTVFDEEIMMFINSAITSLHQLGLGPETSVIVSDETIGWDALGLTDRELGQTKPYIFLKVKMTFDPPTLGFLIEAYNKQITELEWRIANFRESTIDPYYDLASEEEEVAP